MYVNKDTQKLSDEKWEKQQKIGSGSYGNVYKGIDKTTQQQIAIKKLKAPIEEDGIPVEILREIVILRNISHPNVIKLHDVIYTSEKMYLIFEYMDYDLKNFIDSHGDNENIQIDLIREILKQLLNGLAYIHLEGVLHRDLKPQNVLINYNSGDNSAIVKLADFGLARTYSSYSKNLSKNTMTPLYRAPEIFFGADNYSTAIDIWSVGCIFAELVNKKPIFMGNQEIDVIRKIFNLAECSNEDIESFMKNFSVDSKYSKLLLSSKTSSTSKKWKESFPNLDPVGIDLISKMLVIDPLKRISAFEALDHDFFNFLDKKFEDMKRLNKPLPKRESLLLYRDSIKLCRKFFWRNNNGKEWSEILLKSARKEFEENRNLEDTAEVGRKLVLGRQALLELDDRILKVKHDMNKFFEETKIS